MRLLRILTASFWFLLVSLSTCAAADAAEKKQVRPRYLLGGYSPVEELDDSIHQAAALAVHTLRVGGTSYSFVADLPESLNQGDVRIVRAFQQVVAGLNYRLVLAILPASSSSDTEGASACVGAFAVTIYNHFGEMSVTNWGQEIDCTRAMAALNNDEDLNNAMAPEFQR